MSKKYYAIKVGRKPGIYRTWDEAKMQVNHFPNAVYRSFKTKQEAEDFIGGKAIPAKVKTKANTRPKAASPSENSNHTTAVGEVIAYVDGSFSKHQEKYSFGVVLIENNEVIQTLQRAGNNPKYQTSWQIAGEVFGALHAIHWAIKQGYKKIIIYYDYLGIEKWAKGEWRANKDVSKDYKENYQKLAPQISVDFVKVKAHTGVEYNEMADQLAKDALNKSFA